MYYSLKERLKEIDKASLDNEPYVAIISNEEFRHDYEDLSFDYVKDSRYRSEKVTKVVSSIDSLYGSFLVPDCDNKEHFFNFILDKDKAVFIEDGNFVKDILAKITDDESAALSSTTDFIYFFMNQLIVDDVNFFSEIEKELDSMEHRLVNKGRASSIRIAEIRSIIRKYLIHYEQLENALEELTENKNDLFDQEEINSLEAFQKRLERLHDFALDIKEYAQEIRELRREMIDMKQNSINTTLAVVTTIFLPLNLIASWYGMNFSYMPELEWKYGYHMTFIVCIIIAVLLYLFFKKKKWL